MHKVMLQKHNAPEAWALEHRSLAMCVEESNFNQMRPLYPYMCLDVSVNSPFNPFIVFEFTFPNLLAVRLKSNIAKAERFRSLVPWSILLRFNPILGMPWAIVYRGSAHPISAPCALTP